MNNQLTRRADKDNPTVQSHLERDKENPTVQCCIAMATHSSLRVTQKNVDTDHHEKGSCFAAFVLTVWGSPHQHHGESCRSNAMKLPACLCSVCRPECILTHSSKCGCYRLKPLPVICKTLLPLGFELGGKRELQLLVWGLPKQLIATEQSPQCHGILVIVLVGAVVNAAFRVHRGQRQLHQYQVHVFDFDLHRQALNGLSLDSRLRASRASRLR